MSVSDGSCKAGPIRGQNRGPTSQGCQGGRGVRAGTGVYLSRRYTPLVGSPLARSGNKPPSTRGEFAFQCVSKRPLAFHSPPR